MLVLVMCCINVYAAEKVDKNLAIEYMKISKYEDIINASIQQYETQLSSKAKPENKTKFHELMVSTMGWDATKDQLATIIINLYTKEEIDASIAFMKSPAGASATAKNEEFSKQFAGVVSTNLQKMMSNCCAQKQSSSK